MLRISHGSQNLFVMCFCPADLIYLKSLRGFRMRQIIWMRWHESGSTWTVLGSGQRESCKDTSTRTQVRRKARRSHVQTGRKTWTLTTGRSYRRGDLRGQFTDWSPDIWPDKQPKPLLKIPHAVRNSCSAQAINKQLAPLRMREPKKHGDRPEREQFIGPKTVCTEEPLTVKASAGVSVWCNFHCQYQHFDFYMHHICTN